MRTGVIIEDLLANRPAAGVKGRFFHATDTGEVQLDTGSVWTAMGGGGGASLVDGVRAYKTANQSIPATTFEPVTFDVEVYDPAGWHDNVTNPSRFTVPAGTVDIIYLVRGKVEWGSVGGTTRQVRLYKNTVAPYGGTGLIDRSNTPAAANQQEAVFILPLVAGDYVELVGYHDDAGAVDIAGSDEFETNITIEPLRAA